MPDTTRTPPNAAELDALRAEIDALDDALHDLVMRRAAVVARLASSRTKGNGPALRAGREAVILRRLLARHAGPLPKSALVRLWREIFAASTAMQGSFAVAVYAPSTRSGHARLAREHFGAATPIRNHATPSQALATVASGDAAVAVLPAPEDGEPPEAAWWTSLDAPRLQVTARLPFFGEAPAAALVVAPVPPDPSGRDRSLLLIEEAEEMSRGRLQQLLAEAGLECRSLILRRDGPAPRALAEVEGFLRAEDPRLAGLRLCVRPLGAYAVPEPDAPPPGTPAGA